MDLPYVLLIHGEFDGMKVPDPLIRMCEEDWIEIVGPDRTSTCYMVGYDGGASPVKPSAKRYGALHKVGVKELKR